MCNLATRDFYHYNEEALLYHVIYAVESVSLNQNLLYVYHVVLILSKSKTH